jgi:dihydrofolate reductase
MTPPFDLRRGRKTYDVFAGYWPAQGPDDPINKATKYVVTSHPLTVDWPVTIPVSGDIPASIRQLKQQDGPMLQVHGSSQLLKTLFQHDLVDELWLKTFPVVLGKGKRMFVDGAVPAAFELTGSTVSPSGVVVASYKRAGEIKLGSFA